MTSISGWRRLLGRKVRNRSEVRISWRLRINVELCMYTQVVAEAEEALHFENNKAYLNAHVDFLWTPRNKGSLR